jgi:RHS repeat-associated protein
MAKIEGANTYYYHNDHLATPQKMTDSTGAVVWAADYKPFGEATVTVSTITNNLRFPGQYFDAETGLHYNYMRDYNPTIARYVQADPIGIDEGNNQLYTYVANNPLLKIDPKGLLASCSYSIARQVITCTGGCNRSVSCNAEAGDNQLSHQYDENGPLPVGTYTMDPPGHRRPGWSHVYPVNGTDTRGRRGFAIHTGSISTGCILIRNSACHRDLMNLLSREASSTSAGTLTVGP